MPHQIWLPFINRIRRSSFSCNLTASIGSRFSRSSIQVDHCVSLQRRSHRSSDVVCVKKQLKAPQIDWNWDFTGDPQVAPAINYQLLGKSCRHQIGRLNEVMRSANDGGMMLERSEKVVCLSKVSNRIDNEHESDWKCTV